jgi:rubrerythrin
MRATSHVRCFLFAGVLLGLLAVVPLTEAADAVTTAAPPTTLDDLQTAFEGESNAHAKYLLFAERADEEGYRGVASLFRAAARAEEVHAQNHGRVIRALGAEPVAVIHEPEVGATAENLAAAISGESYERDTMYPEFLARAKAGKQKDAFRSFNFAKTAEAEHATLYAAALADLEAWKTVREFFVCSTCGYTTTDLDFAKCISCFDPKEKYELVS